MLLREFNGKQPRLGQGVFVADDVSIIGDVEIGNDVSLWYGVVLRGDIHFIKIGSRTNVQDNCVLHVTSPKFPTIVAEEVTIGHAAIVHGCTVKKGALIGMGSRVLDGAVVGECALVAAGAVVSEGFVVPPRTLVAGVPAKIKRPLTDAELARLDMSWKHYVELKDRYLTK
jgi:carbonic anhydrase/acetyltransferase-like protein (isoleucine patch superfamily)